MGKIQELLPEFIAEVTSSLVSMGHSDLANQLPDLELERWTHDHESEAVYLYLSGQRPLNIVEQNIIGVRHGESIELEDLAGMVLIDTDNFNRVKGIEILWRRDLVEEEGEGGQIFPLDNSNKQPLGSVGRFKGRGELKGRKALGDSHTSKLRGHHTYLSTQGGGRTKNLSWPESRKRWQQGRPITSSKEATAARRPSSATMTTGLTSPAHGGVVHKVWGGGVAVPESEESLRRAV